MVTHSGFPEQDPQGVLREGRSPPPRPGQQHCSSSGWGPLLHSCSQAGVWGLGAPDTHEPWKWALGRPYTPTHPAGRIQTQMPLHVRMFFQQLLGY